LLLVHPKYASRDANADILTKLARTVAPRSRTAADLLSSISAKEGSSDTGAVIGIVIDHDNGWVFRSSAFSRFAYLLVVRFFLRENLKLAVTPSKTAIGQRA
jgi:hypothetical protein